MFTADQHKPERKQEENERKKKMGLFI